MAFITQTFAKTSLFASVKSAFVGFYEGVRLAYSRREQVARFQNMTDRQLDDIGLARADIVAFVCRDK